MKNILLILTAMAINYQISAQSKYNIHFEKESFTYNWSKDGYNISCQDDDFFLLEDASLPALPYKSINILIPENSIIENIAINKTGIEELEYIRINKNPQIQPSSNIKQRSSIKSPYIEEKYPTNNVKFVSVIKMQGFHYASFLICPFIYDIGNSTLHLINNIDITLEFNLKSISEKERAIVHRYDMESIVKNLVINPTELSTLYSYSSKGATKSSSSDVEYLIITSEALAENFSSLKAWKIRKGIRTKIISTYDIYSNYTGDTNELKIKNCIKDYYENNNLKWVLLGGDDAIVPVQGCYGEVELEEETIIDNTIPCDLFYACFDDTFDWDYDGDNIIGETTDDIDMCPEIYISRAPIKTAEHIKTFINKTKEYELYPSTTNYIENMLLAGAEQAVSWGGLSDVHHKSEKMDSIYIAPFWDGTTTKFYDTGTDFSGGAGYDFSSTNLQTQLNSGYHFVHIATHGNQTTWTMETGSAYNTTNASILSNSNSSIILTTACFTNYFDGSESSNGACLSEALLRNENGGCVSYWGSSRQGWGFGSAKPTLGPSFIFNANFYRYLFSGNPDSLNYRFGAVTSVTKIRSIPYSIGYGSKRWLQFSLNAIGDPELPIYTEDPSSFSSATVTQTGTTVIVNTGGVSGCNIALTSMDFGETYFQVEEGVSSATFTNVNCLYHVTITKHNYKPFTYPEDVYIQNHTFTTDLYIQGRNIYVGRNVDPNLTQGDVIIEDGVNIVFDAERDVIIDTGFEAELGGTLKVR
jgi:hypothetical protein